MSHFTVLVIGNDTEKQLAPFSENLEVEGIITVDEFIKKSKDSIESYRQGIYAEYLADPEKYLEGVTNNGHIKYITEDFPLKLEWTDEQHLEAERRWYEPEDINEDGSVNITYNPNSKWDWYQLGGRWRGMLTLKENAMPGLLSDKGWSSPEVENKLAADSALIKDIDFEATGDFRTYGVLKDGEWYEEGQMGWFGMSMNEVVDWDEQFDKLIEGLDPETRISIVDCHI